MHEALESENEVLQVKENRPSGKVAWFVFDAPGLTRGLTLTGSFIQTHTKSPGTGRLRDNCIQPSWRNDARAPENIYILNCQWPATV